MKKRTKSTLMALGVVMIVISISVVSVSARDPGELPPLLIENRHVDVMIAFDNKADAWVKNKGYTFHDLIAASKVALDRVETYAYDRNLIFHSDWIAYDGDSYNGEISWSSTYGYQKAKYDMVTDWPDEFLISYSGSWDKDIGIEGQLYDTKIHGEYLDLMIIFTARTDEVFSDFGGLALLDGSTVIINLAMDTELYNWNHQDGWWIWQHTDYGTYSSIMHEIGHCFGMDGDTVKESKDVMDYHYYKYIEYSNLYTSTHRSVLNNHLDIHSN